MTPVPTFRLFVAALGVAVLRLTLPSDWPGGIWGLNVAVLVVAAVDLAITPRPKQIKVARRGAKVVALGTTGQMAWRVLNTSQSRSVQVQVADELAASLGAAHRRFKVQLAPQARATATTTLTPTRRGTFTPTELVVRTQSRLGLLAWQGKRNIPSELQIHPAFRSRADAELRIQRARMLEIGLRASRGRGSGTDFEQLREYGPDDDPRRIDWAATARSQKAIVRTYRAEQNQTLVVLMDNGRTMAGRVDGVPRVEWAMDAVQCLTMVATRLGDKCGLMIYDRTVRLAMPPSNRRDQVQRVTQAMYKLEPALVESDHQRAFTATLGQFRRRSMLIIISDLTEESVGASLIPALPIVSRRHLVLVAAVQDPAVVEWAEGTAFDKDAGYRKAAAIAALESRQRVAASLKARGAIVVDGPPKKLAVLLTDAYLDAKSTGRL